MSRLVQRWAAGAGGAAVAAVIGASAAHADTTDLFLSQAQDDLTQAGTLFSGLDSSSLPSLGGLASSLDAESGLISQIQTQQDAFSEALQTGSQLVNADQQLASASGELVAASQAFVNAINAGDLPLSATESLTDKLTGLDAGFGFLNAEIFQFLPAELNAAFTTMADGGTIDFAGLTPEFAASAASVAAFTPDQATLLNEASADLNEANTILSGVDVSSEPSSVISEISPATQMIGTQQEVLAGVLNLQDTITEAQAQGASMPGYDVVTQATNALFTNADQSLANGDAAVLASDQMLVAAISSGTGLTDTDMLDSALSTLSAVGDDFSALGTTFDAAFTPFLELFSAF